MPCSREATGRDLSQFKRWYTDAGTPRLKVTDDYADGTYTLHFEQSTPPTPGQTDKPPRVIPSPWGCWARMATRCGRLKFLR